MRTIAPAERTLVGGQNVGFHLRVEVKDSDGTWRDLTALAGDDWVVSATLTADIDQPVMSGTVSLVREDRDGTRSLSPLRSDSTLNRDALDAFAPLLNVGRLLRISTAATTPGAAPAAGDWREMVVGKIDSIPLAGDPLVVAYRDLGAELLDAVIEEERPYGSDNGTAVEVVMQAILDDTLGVGVVTLAVPASPQWYIRTYAQQAGVSVLDALRALALQIGWDVRYWYDATDTFTLVFQAPDRTSTTVLDTFGPDEYLAVPQLDLSDADVRNIVRVRYLDQATQQAASVLASDAGSIAEFGRRYMEIGEGSSSNIDTATEALTMADAAVRDLRSPKVTQGVETFGFWPVQLGDLYTFLANGVHYDADQQLAVVGFQHQWTAGHMSTTLTARGTPAGAYRAWLLTRNGAFSGDVSHGPVPVLGPLTGEATAFDGAVDREGMAWLAFRFTQETEHIEVYAVEGAASPVPVPELSESRKAWTIRRQDGEVASADEWASWVMVATRAEYYRKIIAFGVGYDGARGPTIILEAQAHDTGTPPSAPPDTLLVTTDGDTNTVQFTVRDPNAIHLIFRNGFVLGFIEAGVYLAGDVASFSDPHVDTGIEYSYDVCAFRNSQTSAFASQGVVQPPVSDAIGAPTWVAGYPLGVDDPLVLLGLTYHRAGCEFKWTCDATATSIAVEVESTTVPGTWYTLLGPFTDAGHIPAGDEVHTYGTATGTTRRVRLVAIMPGGGKLYSAPVIAQWGTTAPPVAPYAKPEWTGTAPTLPGGGGVQFDWTVPDPRCTQLEVEEQISGVWTSLYVTTDAAAIASGSRLELAAGTTDWYRLKATYPSARILYALARRPGEAV